MKKVFALIILTLFFSITFISFLNFRFTDIQVKEVIETSEYNIFDEQIRPNFDPELIEDSLVLQRFYKRGLDADYPYRLGLNMVRAGESFSSHDFVYKDLENLGAQGIRQIQGHDLNWSVIWRGYGEGVGETNSSGKCINVPKGCSGSSCWYNEPSGSKVKDKEDAFVLGDFNGTNEDFSDPDNYDFSDAQKFMRRTSFYYQPTLFITGLSQNRKHFICLDENDEEEEDYCHENGAKNSDIKQCHWLYTPNGYKITLDSGDDDYSKIKKAIKGYLNNVAEKSSAYGLHHYEIGNELERFPHPSYRWTYDWSYIDRYYMRLLKLSKETLVNKYEDLGLVDEPKVMFAGLFSTDYEFDDYRLAEEPHSLNFFKKTLKEIKNDMDDNGTDINDYFDIFNFHHYQGWTTLRAHINNIKNLLEDQIGGNVLDDVAIWATELGLTNSDIENGPFYLIDGNEGKVEYYCNGHLLDLKDGVTRGDLTSTSVNTALDNCETKFVNNTLKESRNMLKYMAVSWGNGVKLINWHTHLQNSSFYLGLRLQYDSNTTAMEGCTTNSDDPTMSAFSREDHANYCAKTSWFVYQKIAEKLGNFKKSSEIHYDNNGWFLYLFSQQQYSDGVSGKPRFVSWLGCPDEGGSCSDTSGKNEEVTIYQLMKHLSDNQKSKYNGCLKLIDLTPNCTGKKRAFCSKFDETEYNFTGDGGTVSIPVNGYPSIIEPCN